METKILSHLARLVRLAGALARATSVVVLGLPVALARAQDTATATSTAPHSTAAGDTAQNMADMSLIRAAINGERVDLVKSYLGLSDAEATAFWPLYKQYRNELNKVSDDQVRLVGNYLQSRDTLSDDDAKKLAEGLLNNRKKRVDIQKRYLGKFAKILPGKKVARLYQLENKMDTVLAYEAADRLPLIPIRPAAAGANK